MQSIDQFGGHWPLPTWLYRLAADEVLLFLERHEEGKKRKSAGESSHFRSGERLHADHQQLESAFAKLDPDFRVIFRLREVTRLSYAEIGKVPDITEGTVGMRLNRARRQLHELLGDGD